MSNFAPTPSYVHGSSEAQQGNPPAHTVVDLSTVVVPAEALYALDESYHAMAICLLMQVGTEFSRQFYFVLTQQPSLAHRFYTDGSSLTHSTGGSGFTVFGQTVRMQPRCTEQGVHYNLLQRL